MVTMEGEQAERATPRRGPEYQYTELVTDPLAEQNALLYLYVVVVECSLPKRSKAKRGGEFFTIHHKAGFCPLGGLH